MKAPLALFAVLHLAGCATAASSIILIGEPRQSIDDWSSVTITDEMPEGAIPIATVRAKSNSGRDMQASAEYAIEELKKRAAKFGANTVVIRWTYKNTNRDREVILPSILGLPVNIETDTASFEGTAVHVDH